MAIAYKSAGTGAATETSGAALSPTCPATVDANDILIAHVFWEGTTTAPSTPSGWTLLSGPHVIESTIARHWAFGKIADGTEDAAAVAFGNPAVTTQRGARVYSFSGYVSGTITQLCHFFAHLSDANDPQFPTVTTSLVGGLAVGLVGQNDNNAQVSATGETGGDWTEAVAEFTAGLTPGLALQLQTCTPTANPGTVSGGAGAGFNDPVGVIGFAIEDQPWSQLTANAAGIGATTAEIVKVQGATQYSLTASVASLSTTTTPMSARRALTASASGIAAASTPTLYRRVVVASSGALGGLSTVTVSEASRRSVAATAASTSSVAVSMSVVRALGGVSASGLSSTTADIVEVEGGGTTYNLTASVAGQGATTVSLAVRSILTATAAGLSSTVVSLSVVRALGGITAAGAGVASSVVVAVPGGGTTYNLTASVAGLGVASTPNLYRRVVVASSGALAGTSTVTATVSRSAHRDVTAAGIATTTADIVKVGATSYQLTATAAGTSAASASYGTVIHQFTASAAGAATAATPTLYRRVVVASSGALGGTSNVTVVVVKQAPGATQFTASAAGLGVSSATLYKITQVAGGAVTGTSTATVAIQRAKPCAVTVAGTGAASATVVVIAAPQVYQLTATAAGTSSAATTPITTANLTAGVSGIATVSVAVQLQAPRLAAATGVSATVVSLSVRRAFFASAAGTGSAEAHSQAIRVLLAAASAAAVATVEARYSRALSASANGSGVVTLTVTVALGTEVVLGKYAAEHAAAYRVVKAAEEGDFAGIHAQAFADVFKAGV